MNAAHPVAAHADPLMPALQIRQLSLAYAGKPALQAVDATFPTGSLTAIIGPNGAGKSSLLKAALGILRAETGSALFFGAPLAAVRSRVAYVPQRAAIDWDFPARVADVVAMGLYREMGLLGRLNPARRQRIKACLAELGMAEYHDRQIGALSGGQQQRVFLARALAQNADLMLLDEPLAGVDSPTEATIMRVLAGLRNAGGTIIAVHHDLATVPRYFDRVLLLNGRVIAEGPLASTFTPDAIARTYQGGIASDGQQGALAGGGQR